MSKAYANSNPSVYKNESYKFIILQETKLNNLLVWKCYEISMRTCDTNYVTCVAEHNID